MQYYLFTETERELTDRLLDEGVIEPFLITSEENLQGRIRQYPLLDWKALNVRKYKEK